MSGRLTMLEHKERKDREQVKTLKPKELNKAKTLQWNCPFFQWDKHLSFVNINFVSLLEVTVNQEIPSFREGTV